MSGSDPQHRAPASDLCQRLQSDHECIARSLEHLAHDPEAPDGARLLTTLAAIEEHLALEEWGLHPALRTSLHNGDSVVIRAMADAAQLEWRISTLRSPDLSSRQRARLLDSLRSLVHEHIQTHERRHVIALTS